LVLSLLQPEFCRGDLITQRRRKLTRFLGYRLAIQRGISCVLKLAPTGLVILRSLGVHEGSIGARGMARTERDGLEATELGGDGALSGRGGTLGRRQKDARRDAERSRWA